MLTLTEVGRVNDHHLSVLSGKTASQRRVYRSISRISENALRDVEDRMLWPYGIGFPLLSLPRRPCRFLKDADLLT